MRFFFIFFLLLGCHSARTTYEYEMYRIDDAWKANLDDDFGRYLQHWPELDSSRDGYYLVYSLAVDAVEPSAYLFFYDKGDSITICPFDNGLRSCKKYAFESENFLEKKLESAQPLFPNSVNGSLRERIYGYRKKAEKKRYYLLIQMDACHRDVACKDQWRQSIQENIEQYNMNALLFNRFAYLVEFLIESESLEKAFQVGKFSYNAYEKFLRNHQERLSSLEQEYKELLNKSMEGVPKSHK